MLVLLSAPRGRVSPLRLAARAAQKEAEEGFGIVIRLPVQPQTAHEPPPLPAPGDGR